MTDREKIIELLMQKGFGIEGASIASDYLLANGVTIADKTASVEKPRWIPVAERLPGTIPCNAGTAYSEAVIVWTSGRKAMIAVWDGIDFLCAADYWEAWGEKITHWMPLPEPPKMEDVE